MKKLLAFLLALMMLTALFSGCSNDSDDDDDDDGKTIKTEEIESAEDLIGTWTMRVDLELMGGEMKGLRALKEAGFDYDYMECKVTFDEDGKMTSDGKSSQEAQLEMMEALVKWVKKGDNIYAYAEFMEGMDRAEFDAMLEEQGRTKEDALEELDRMLEMQKQNAEMYSEDTVMNYAYEDGKLYTWGEYSKKGDGECFTIGKSGKILVVLENLTE